MFVLAPTMGRGGAHEPLAYLGTAGVLAGLALLGANLAFGFGDERAGARAAPDPLGA